MATHNVLLAPKNNSDLTAAAATATAEDEDVSKYDSQKLQFPWKLHRLLDDADEKGYSSMISWMQDGKSFRVHDKARFEAEVMPLYFDSSKFKSFQRSLNLWGFHTLKKGGDRGKCVHNLFIRGYPDLCNHMKRTRAKGNVAIHEDNRMPASFDVLASSYPTSLRTIIPSLNMSPWMNSTSANAASSYPLASLTASLLDQPMRHGGLFSEQRHGLLNHNTYASLAAAARLPESDLAMAHTLLMEQQRHLVANLLRDVESIVARRDF